MAFRRRRRSTRRRAPVRRARARSVARKTSRRRRKSGLMSGTSGDVIGGAIYGALQEPMDAFLSSRIRPFVGFAGNYSGNVARLATLWGIKKFVKNPTVRSLANKGFIAEGVDIGKQLASGFGVASVSSNSGTSAGIFSTAN